MGIDVYCILIAGYFCRVLIYTILVGYCEP